jgi:hypothetical protein
MAPLKDQVQPNFEATTFHSAATAVVVVEREHVFRDTFLIGPRHKCRYGMGVKMRSESTLVATSHGAMQVGV